MYAQDLYLVLLVNQVTQHNVLLQTLLTKYIVA